MSLDDFLDVSTLDHIPAPTVVIDDAMQIWYANLPAQSALGAQPFETQDKYERELLKESLQSPGSKTMDTTLNGTRFRVHAGQTVGGKRLLSLTCIKDLVDSTYTDSLTGLKNKRGLREALQRELARSTRAVANHSQEVSQGLVYFLDVDFFKQYNDAHGHTQGDHALYLVGQILRHSVREADIVARFGGDEFAIVQPSTSNAVASTVTQRLYGLLQDAIHREELRSEPQIGLSVGVTNYTGNEEVDRVLDRADNAMYTAKRAGKNRAASLWQAIPGRESL